mgnify:CR=1 FL=1
MVGFSVIRLIAIAMALMVAPIQAAAPESTHNRLRRCIRPECRRAAHCVAKGGVVEVRTPYWNTNDDNPDNWLRLAGSRSFCEFTADDGSRIHVLPIDAVHATAISSPRWPTTSGRKLQPGCHGNPASCYCTQLGGSDSFGWNQH